jgi:hypothetical protein
MDEGSRAANPPVRPRPALLRALGRDEPPASVEIDGLTYRLERVFKHDSWAATALYAGTGRQVVCKFNRRQRIGPIPMGWLGRWLARREARALRKLNGVPGVPPIVGEVRHAGRVMSYAVGHDFIPGRPLGRHDRPGGDYFPRLEALLTEVHRRGLAYVDLHKRENILVGADGRPYLVDFQISYCLPGWWPANALPARLLLWLLQRSDRYHLVKHRLRCSPDRTAESAMHRPWWIHLHRCVARPARTLRRWLLVRLGVRAGAGHVETEFFPEEVVRADRLVRGSRTSED